jgi:TPP-dependent pyruvate/acetoin dehydrogenase alpha subunit
MTQPVAVRARPSVSARFGAFVLERFPFAAAAASSVLEAVADGDLASAEAIERARTRLAPALRRALGTPPQDLPETTPAVSAGVRWTAAVDELVEACDGFLRRASIAGSLSADERREMLRGMALTRATDNRLKAFFTGGEVRYGDGAFQGKGFRSLGQEAIYGAAIRLRRGGAFRTGGEWHGDVVAPLIRDLGVAIAMKPDGETVRMVLSAQMAKAGPPMNGRDLHIGDLGWGILPAAAPLAISTMTAAGMAMAFSREGKGRVALTFIGEGGSSLGEWHEAINLCAARRLPAVFCVQNNQTALSTPVRDQSAVRVFADKAQGYGVPGITIDGTDPDEIAAAFA